MSIWQEPLGPVDENPIWLVGARGRLDHTLIPELEESLLALLNAGHSRLLVDLSDVEYINSGGLRCLLSAWRQARQQEGSLSLCGLNRRLSDIFDMVGFDKVFDIYPTCEAARRDL